jgi:hypothetical protein
VCARAPGQVHRTVLRRLRPLHLAQADGALDPERPVEDIDVAGLQGEGFARPEARLGEDGEERAVAAVGLRRVEERRALLPRHRADLLHALRRGQLLRAVRLAPADLKRGVRHDQAVIDGVGEHRRQRGLHETHGVLRVASPALLGKERLDVRALQIAEPDVSQRREHVAGQAAAVAADGGELLVDLDLREPARGIIADADVAIDSRRREAAPGAQHTGRVLVRLLLGGEEGATAHATAVAVVDLPQLTIPAIPDLQLRSLR